MTLDKSIVSTSKKARSQILPFQYDKTFNHSHVKFTEYMRASKYVHNTNYTGPMKLPEFEDRMHNYFPNAGIILMDLSNLRRSLIPQRINSLIEHLSEDGPRVLGTMSGQAMVLLTMHHIWSRLPEHINLRPIPHIARAQHLPSNYKGILHLAGKIKPHYMCSFTSGESFARDKLEMFVYFTRTAYNLINSEKNLLIPDSHILRRCANITNTFDSIDNFYNLLKQF